MHTLANHQNRKAHSPNPLVSQLSCAILILNYNGEKHLHHLLPTLREAVARHSAPVPVPVVIVDNRSTNDDVAYVRLNFPEFEVVVAEKNDFLFSLNPAVAARTEDVVIILNNDMRVEADFIQPLLARLEDPDVFVAGPAIMSWEGAECTNGKRLPEIWRRLWFTERYEADTQHTPSYTLETGNGAFRREMFNALGGFDSLFRPGYWEDVDICYRAWARGWKCVYEPKSVIYHRVSGTFGAKTERVYKLYHRNRVLFVVKNIGSIPYALGYTFLLPLRLFTRAIRHRNWPEFKGMLSALGSIPKAWLHRFREQPNRRYTSRQVLARINEPINHK